HAVDALQQPEAGRRRDVGGGKAQLAAALVAPHYLAGKEPVIAEQLAGAHHVARAEQGADARGGDVVVALVEHIEDVDLETMAPAGILEKVRRTLALVAEMEIGADRDAGDRQRVDEKAGDEILGLDMGKGQI